MPLWLWILLFAALIKIPLAGLMLWIPFRYDESAKTSDVPDSSEDDGGSKALPGGPLDPHPRSPSSAHGRVAAARLTLAAVPATRAHQRAQPAAACASSTAARGRSRVCGR